MPIELSEPSQSQRTRNKNLALLTGAAFLLLGGAAFVVKLFSGGSVEQPEYLQCKQPDFLEPDFKALGLHSSSDFLTPEYQNRSVELLAGAIRIPTVSYDDMSFEVTKDPRFDVFFDLHKYLATNFPLLTRHVEKINTYGLLYTIEGTDPSLKPIVFMAHQDVVPVAPATADEWTEDPFGGLFDGEWIHGRGTSDTKNSLIAMHESVEALLSQKWKPKRTLLLSFGFDEEIQGWRGARKLSEHIENKYGKNSVEMLIDEGFGFSENFGAHFASPAVAEKGRINFRVTLKTPGGHSSMPPDHTGIGIMSELVTRLEEDVPLTPELRSDVDAVKAYFSCFGHHGEDLKSNLRDVYKGLGSPKSDNKLTEMLASDITSRVLVETTQAIDTIRGGVKINALPEEVVLEVNYRIKPASSVKKETARFMEKVSELSSKFVLGANYTDTFKGQEEQTIVVPLPKEPKGTILVETTDALEVAPISPFYNSTHWDLIGGTTKNVLENVASEQFGDLPLYMSPSLMTGNTDTSHYWNLTENIYRYMPVKIEDMRSIHTVNEGLRFRSHLSSVAFYYEFLINAQDNL